MKGTYQLHVCRLQLENSQMSESLSSGRLLSSPSIESQPQSSRRIPPSARENNYFNVHHALRSFPNSRQTTPEQLPKLNFRGRIMSEESLSATNSLFQINDGDSVEKYIADLEEKEDSMTPKRTERNNGGSKSSSPSLPKVNLEHLMKEVSQSRNFVLRSNNVSGWEIRPSSVAAQTASFRLLELIMLRESLLEKLRDLVWSIDRYHWKYCVLRIRAVEVEGKLLNCEELVLRQNRLFSMQKELSVAIAHLRSASLEVVEALMRLRQLLKKEVDLREAEVSVFWRQSNYLLKMSSDVHILFEASSLRYWIGFVPNALMIPPADHRPREKWEKLSSSLLQRFLRLHRDKLGRDRKNSTGSGRARKTGLQQQDRRFVSDNLNLLSTLEESSASNPSPSPNPIPGSDPSQSQGQSRQRSLEDWEQLRDYCSYSWTRAKLVTSEWPLKLSPISDDEEGGGVSESFLQEESSDSFFWSSGEHSPYVVEAALGFKELFPSVLLVPPLPSQLLMRSLKLQHFLSEELRRVRAVQQRRERSLEAQSLFSSLSSSSERGPEALARKFQLKYRQQRDGRTLFGVDSSFLLSEFQQYFSSETLQQSSVSVSVSVSKPMQLASEEEEEEARGFFLTTNNNTTTNTTTADSNAVTASQSLYTQYEDSEDQQLSVEKLWQPFSLEQSQSSRLRIERKILRERERAALVRELPLLRSTSSRQLRVSFDSCSGPKSVKSRRKSKYGNRFSREFSRLDLKWFQQHATNIQRMVRGFLSRRRVRRLRAQKSWRRAIVKVQSASRGFLLRLQSQRRLQEEKIQTFLLRKAALKQFRAAILITQFIRRVVNLKRLRSNEPLLFDRLDRRGQVATRHQTFFKLKEALARDSAAREALLLHDSPYKSLLLLRPPQLSETDNSSLSQLSLDSDFSQPATNEKSFSQFLEETERDLSPSRPSSTSQPSPNPNPNPRLSLESIAEAEDSSLSLGEDTAPSLLSFNEADRLRFQKMQAQALIKRVNENKLIPDSLRSSRLIPVQETKALQLKKRKTVLSKNHRSFLVLPGEGERKSLLKDPNEAFIPPLKRSLLPSSAASVAPSEAGSSLADRLQSRQNTRKSVDFEDSWSSHASKILSMKQEKEMKEQEKFRASLKKYF